ncbi:MAG: WG repeat-containing protein, partial [Bacteroidota bacterium]
MYCSNCGAKIVGKPNFCSSCGHKIDYTSNQQLQAFPVKKSNGFTLASKENVIIGNGHYESVTPLLKVEDKRFFTVTEGYNQGIIDENGKVILPMEFNSVRTILNYSSTDKDHADGLIADKVLVYKERKFGIFDLKTGSLVIPVSYYNISSISYDHNLILINESYDVKFFNLTTLAISDNFTAVGNPDTST